ncbi:MAG: DinB family protein [Candidatus Limnocylindria bacterium]
MDAFVRILARLASLSDADLGAPARWRGREGADVRYALLHWTLEQEQDAVVRARTDYTGTEAQRILGLAQVAYGDLRGLLAGVGSEALDRAPREGEWSARETLVHTVAVERSYRANTAHALARSASDPLTLSAEQRPEPDPADTAGDGSAIALRLGARRAETDAELGGIAPEQMTLPTQWSENDVDVRFRLHRFASHLVEHTVQCERALEAAGLPFGDARRVVRRISVARAMHERITSPDDLARLDSAHQEALAAASEAWRAGCRTLTQRRSAMATARISGKLGGEKLEHLEAALARVDGVRAVRERDGAVEVDYDETLVGENKLRETARASDDVSEPGTTGPPMGPIR